VGHNNSVVFVVPGPNGYFGARLCDFDHVMGPLDDIEDVLPENWDEYDVHLWPAEEAIKDIVARAKPYLSKDFIQHFLDYAITHVALVEGPIEDDRTRPFKFGGTDVHCTSILLLYSAYLGRYVAFHCDQCAVFFAKWLEAKQPEWWDENSGFRDPRKAYN